MMENLHYATAELERYFSRNRIRWDQFYPSERGVLEHIDPSPSAAVLDVGCGCGGLGLALAERFGISDYTGVEINEASAETARRLNPRARILRGDFLRLGTGAPGREAYDLVFSLGCIDWNLRFDEMLNELWARVRPQGALVSSFRITRDAGINDIGNSYQYINFDGKRAGEIAPYVVVNARDLMAKLAALRGGRIFACGYYGPPGESAVTPYSRLCFAAMAIYKSGDPDRLVLDLQLPDDIALDMSPGA